MTREPITRNKKKAKVREAIVKAALELFERQGFERTTVDEIAAAAEVSTRTFFRYFPTKDHVMFPYHAEYVARFRDLLHEQRSSGPPLDMVRASLKAMAEFYMSDRSEHRRFQQVISASPALVARSVVFDSDWESAIEEAWRDIRRSAADRREARLIAGAVMGVINAVMAMWYAEDCKADLVSQGEAALDLLERGIGNGAAVPKSGGGVLRKTAAKGRNA